MSQGLCSCRSHLRNYKFLLTSSKCLNPKREGRLNVNFLRIWLFHPSSSNDVFNTGVAALVITGKKNLKWTFRTSSRYFAKWVPNFYRDSSNFFSALGRRTSVVLELNGGAREKIKYSTVPEFGNVKLSDDEKNGECMANENGVHDYTLRTHSCGELRSSDIGKKVTLCGWVAYNRLNKFILLRDSYGTTQVIVPQLKNDDASKLHLESVICVTGVVKARPPAQVLKHLETGEIEVLAVSVNVFNNCTPNLPLHIREYKKALPQVLNRYRYLALRFPEYQYSLRLRSEMLFRMREFLITKKEFVEVETPTLFKKTPGGAQEFIVPTHEKNKFYSLVQSPQQLKQLLMVGSIDRYFQIARCYRDETSTSDRQPEFTQLDLELSFTDMNGVMKLTEDVLVASWPKDKNPPKAPFLKMSYQHAIENYGSDKPCILDKFLIQNMKPYIQGNTSSHFYMFTIPNGRLMKEKFEKYFELLIREDSPKIHVIEGETVQKLNDSLTGIIADFNAAKFQEDLSVKGDDLIFLAEGVEKLKTLETLGLCRHHVINELDLIQRMNADGIYDFLWVVDFPLFEMKNNEIKSSHHPFTHPYPDDLASLSKDPLKVRSLAYDLVLNGSEIGGGSVRIHDAKLQEEILTILGLPKDHFSHMLEALQMGCPPHGGIALGIDRLIAILCNRRTIKDVIAFPKGGDGQDLMTECPADIPVADKIRYHIPS